MSQFGQNIGHVLGQSEKYCFLFRECGSAPEFYKLVERTAPAAVIYNYYASTLSWVTRRLTTRHPIPHIGILHEVTQEVADRADNRLFDYHIAPDPSLLLRNAIVFKTGRLVPNYNDQQPTPETPTIGSFGFGTQGKGFPRIVRQVEKEYDRALIRLHIPFAAFGDIEGEHARAIAAECAAEISKPGIHLRVTHEFLSRPELLGFLASNTINAFFYDDSTSRGISSAIDLALAVKRPIALTRSSMFRHLFEAHPSIFIEDLGLRQIAQNGFSPLSRFRDEWTDTNIIWDYERILDRILSGSIPPRPLPEILGKVARRLRRIFLGDSAKTVCDRDKTMGLYLPNRSTRQVRAGSQISYSTAEIDRPRFNRILDDSARELYAPTIRTMFKLVPELMARKIARANVQQAFVLDTVARLIGIRANAKIIGVGAYEDTAADSLLALGHDVERIDPALNYDLSTFLTKPSTQIGTYDVVFSTSVLEHVRDDERFISEIGALLAPGGVAVLTCDYNNDYKPGDKIPAEDIRFYTERDLRERLLPAVPDCELLDDATWNCPSPDFSYSGCRYTFATLVFRKPKL